MSECRFFWTNFHKAVESDPVCPTSVTIAIFNLGQYGSGGTDEFVFTEQAAPNGGTGVDLVTGFGVSVGSKPGFGNVGWVGLDSFTANNSLWLLPALLAGGGGPE